MDAKETADVVSLPAGKLFQHGISSLFISIIRLGPIRNTPGPRCPLEFLGWRGHGDICGRVIGRTLNWSANGNLHFD